MDASALESAESWLSFLWYFKVGAALLVALGVSMEFAGDWISRPFEKTIEDAHKLEIATLEKAAEDAKSETARLSLEAESARGEIAKANEGAAKANEKAAKLETEAAQARLEQEHLKAQFAWRVLPATNAAILKQQLSRHLGGAINIQYVANDPEALYFAIQLSNLFAEANWQGGMLSTTVHGSVVFGLWLPDSPSPSTTFARAAFQAAKIEFGTTGLPPGGGVSFGNMLPDAATLFIGSKQIQTP